MHGRLDKEGIDGALERLPGWLLSNDSLAIKRTLRFDDFASAFGFMAQAASVAEEMNHHPEWADVWNRVDILLTTHSAKGLTVLDIELASGIDTIAARYAFMCDVGDGRLL